MLAHWLKWYFSPSPFPFIVFLAIGRMQTSPTVIQDQSYV